MLGASPTISRNFENINFTFPNQSHIRTYYRQVKALNLTAIVHSTTHTLLCISWMRYCTLKQVILIQWINGVHLRMGVFCHQHCGKHRCQHGLRKMRESARNDICELTPTSRVRTNASKIPHMITHTLSHFIKCRHFLQTTHLIVNCNMVLSICHGVGVFHYYHNNYNDYIQTKRQTSF